MASIKRCDTSTDSGNDLDEDQQTNGVLITNVPPGTKREELIIYFQKESNGGGEVNMNATKMLEDGKAVVVFDEEEVARRVLMKEHEFNGTLLQLKPSTDDMKVFSLVSAKLDPSRFTVDVKELHNLLVKTREKTGVRFMETCKGFLVAGTLEQIHKSCLFLSKYAKPPDDKRESSNGLENGQGNGDALNDSDDEGKSLETMVLDVEPKLMHLLQKELDIIEKKYKMKIDWKRNSGKAHLSPNGKDVSLFDQGKEEFITLYQKEFQDLQERDLSLDAVKNIADLEKTTKELTQNFAVVIEKKDDKVLHIFGKEKDVSQVMNLLQAKFGKRRGRKAYKEPSNGELPKPDTYAQAAMLHVSKTLDNGVVVSVHQGDLTRVQVDVIVNAANENLLHGGGVAGAIVKQGGRQIQQESDALIRVYGRVPVGQVAHTGPGNLPYKRIFHAVGPQWKVHGEQASRQFIFDACMNSFNLASKHRMSSIALPGISSGIYGVPKEICAEMMFTAAEMFSAEAPSNNLLKDIRFVNIDTPTYEAFQREFCSRYGSLKEKETNLVKNPYDENAVHSPFETDKEREYQRMTYQENLGSAQRANNVDSERKVERQKRADAANRRMEQEKREETAKDGEQPRKYEVLSKIPLNENKPNFVDGFNKRGNRSSESKKFEGRQNAMNSHAPNDNERGSTEGTVEFAHAREEKAEEEKREKINKEKFKKEGDGKEAKKGEEKVMEGNEPEILPKHDNQNQLAEELIYDFGNLEIKEERKESVKAQGNDKRITENGDQGGKKQPDFLDAPDKSLNDSKDVTEEIEKENRFHKSFSRKSSDRRNNSEHTSNPENKSLRSAGRGRGARTLAPAFQDTSNPGHAVRQNQSNIHAENRNEGNESCGSNRRVPPGLTITQDGLELAKKATRGDESVIEVECILNVRKKHLLENESKDITEGVPAKKAKDDEDAGMDNDDEQGEDDEGSEEKTKDNSTPISSEGTEPKKSMSSNYERGDDGDSSGQDSKEVSTIVSAEETKPKKSLDPHDERVGDGQGSNAKEKSAAVISAEENEPNEPLDSEDGRSSDQDEVKPTKLIDSKDDRVKEDQISDQDAKQDKIPHTEIIGSSDKPDYEHQKDQKEKNSRDTPYSDDISNFSARPDSMNSFELVSMPPNNDQMNHLRDARTSGSTDESSESIVVINLPEGDEMSDHSSSSPVNEQEGNDVHPPDQDISRSKMGSSEEEEEKEKLPVLSVAEKNENDKKEEDAAAGSGGVGEIANPDEERASHSPSAEDISRDEDVAGSSKMADSSSGNSSLPALTEGQECGLCYQVLDLAQAVKICDHFLCQNCVKNWGKNEISNTCKICHRSVQIALQPLNGQMTSSVIEGSLPGYDGCETLYIDFEFPEGVQGPFHPNPGTPYDKLSRRTFLPNNEGGKEVLELFTKAFDAEVLFTVGKSTISGKDNQIIFNPGIDQKTNIEGGPTVSGYPDPEYLSRVKEQLKAKGIE